ncbi:MAG: Hpt domain-containing protein [Proteobacteria bacterium]|nr:Hpt domain-containing protein [Pseudomonadota bacterium]MBU1717078.1 Hpt domain-containing protein [Pseudomonadota bacterium]
METGAEIFRNEAYELLEDAEQALLELRGSPQDPDLIARLFRDIHTVKGSGAMFGFDRVADFSHKFETAIDAVRHGEAVLTENLIDNLLLARDHILKLIDAGDDDLLTMSADSERIIAGLTGGGIIGEPPPMEGQAAVADGEQEQLALEKGVGGLKILIVEDEFVCRYMLQEFLMGYGVTHVAVNGFEAIIAFKRALSVNKPYDLICLDIMMPGMDGRAVATEIRRLEAERGSGASCRIVVTTAVHDPKFIAELVEGKLCDAYLVKPFELNSMRDKLREYFGK